MYFNVAFLRYALQPYTSWFKSDKCERVFSWIQDTSEKKFRARIPTYLFLKKRKKKSSQKYTSTHDQFSFRWSRTQSLCIIFIPLIIASVAHWIGALADGVHKTRINGDVFRGSLPKVSHIKSMKGVSKLRVCVSSWIFLYLYIYAH